MAGYTGFLTGLVNNRVVYLPMAAVCANSPRAMNATGRTWERVIALTRQPNTVKAGGRGGDRASSVGSASSHVESLMP
jgi:6-phosphofructokinase 1